MSLEIPDMPVLERAPSSNEMPAMSEPAFKSEFLKTMQARGYIHQVSHPEELDSAAPAGLSPPTSASTPRRPAYTSAT